ncbi:hypothetical protein Scep_023912 [Stephania cephalantha]|uniref:Uncharacterized protein n=1 Tax=Stephania cephalantha TaxID=152367 RepID=A0AAP0HWN8_9MAGN
MTLAHSRPRWSHAAAGHPAICCRLPLVEKGLNKDQGGEGDGDIEEGSDDEDEESGEVDPIPILDNDSEFDVESTEKRGFEHSGDGEERCVEHGENPEVEKKITKNMEDEFLVSTLPLGDEGRDQEGNNIPLKPPVKGSVQSKVEHAQNEPDVLPSFTMGASSSQQPSDLFHLFFDELKATMENHLDRIEDFLVSLDGKLQKMNDAFNKAAGDVCIGMQTIHKDMDCLPKRATDVEKKMMSSRHVMKEFVDRMDPMVDEYRGLSTNETLGRNRSDGAIGVAPLGEYGAANGVDGGGVEGEGGLVVSQQSHLMLVGRRAMEPPLQVQCKEALHRVYVTTSQHLIQGFEDYIFG